MKRSVGRRTLPRLSELPTSSRTTIHTAKSMNSSAPSATTYCGRQQVLAWSRSKLGCANRGNSQHGTVGWRWNSGTSKPGHAVRLYAWRSCSGWIRCWRMHRALLRLGHVLEKHTAFNPSSCLQMMVELSFRPEIR